MEMLILKPRSKEGRKKAGKLPVLRVRGRKYGPILHEQVMRRTQDIAVYGPHGCGKSRWVMRLADAAGDVWPGRESVCIRAIDPLANWTEAEAVGAWHDSKPDRRQDWAKVRQSERVELMVTWAREVGPVLLIDDVHRLTGRKADIAGRMIECARIVVYSASDEARIPMSLRLMLGKRRPQVVALSSAAAYDYTGALTWLLCIVAAAMGAWPVAAAIGGLKLAARGNRAAKQS